MALRIILTLVLTIIFFPGCAHEAQNFEVFKVNDNFHVLTGKESGTNIGVISIDKNIVLVDPMPGDTKLEQLHELITKTSQKKMILVLNTHNHSDHTGGNEYFRNQGAEVLDNVPQSLGIVILEVKSHSPSDKILFYKAGNAVFVGDVFDNSWHPTFYSGGVKGFNAAIDKILELGDEESLIIPGHGKPADKTTLRAFHKNTLAWMGLISEFYYSKKSVEQIMNDEKSKNILELFNTENKEVFLPEGAVKRFIERSISVIESQENSSKRM